MGEFRVRVRLFPRDGTELGLGIDPLNRRLVPVDLSLAAGARA